MRSTSSIRRDEPHSNTMEKITICLIASLVPFITMVSKYDIDWLTGLTPDNAIGYSLKVLAILGSGLIVVFILAPDEKNRRKIFFLALSAPAYLSTALGQQSGRLALDSNPFISSAFAQSEKLGRWPEDSTITQIFQGFTGTVPKKTYWVQLSSERNSADAIQAAEKLQKDNANLPYTFRAYPSYLKNGFFAVIMQGPFYSQEEANRAFQVAKDRNLSENPILFALPRS